MQGSVAGLLLGELLGAVAHLVLQVPVHVLELEVLLARHLIEALDLLLQVEVVDPTGGQSDLEARVLRAINVLNV